MWVIAGKVYNNVMTRRNHIRGSTLHMCTDFRSETTDEMQDVDVTYKYTYVHEKVIPNSQNSLISLKIL